MRVHCEVNLPNFEFWCGAKENAKQLTYEELEELEWHLEDIYPDGIEDTQLNDIMWFDFEWVCECLGLRVDECGDIIREEETEEETEQEDEE